MQIPDRRLRRLQATRLLLRPLALLVVGLLGVRRRLAGLVVHESSEVGEPLLASVELLRAIVLVLDTTDLVARLHEETLERAEQEEEAPAPLGGKRLRFLRRTRVGDDGVERLHVHHVFHLGDLLTGEFDEPACEVHDRARAPDGSLHEERLLLRVVGVRRGHAIAEHELGLLARDEAQEILRDLALLSHAVAFTTECLDDAQKTLVLLHFLSLFRGR